MIYAPGDYEVTITGAAGLINATTKSSTFSITLIDPCDPPVSITGVDLIDQSYTIGLTGASVVHPDFITDRAFCPLVYTYEITELVGAA